MKPIDRYKVLLVLVLFGQLWGCSSVQVNQDYNLSQDFSRLKTYAWRTAAQPATGDIRVDNALLDNRIRAAIDQALSKKGYQSISQGTPDFFVAYTCQIRSKIESNSVTFGFGFGTGSARYGGIGLNSGGNVREYDEDFLVIDIYDSSKEALLWRGTGTSPYFQHSKPEETVKAINEKVDKILAQFPPKPE